MRKLLFVLLLPVSMAHAADAYPSKAVRMLVPSLPGGGGDATARVISPKLAELWGQPVFIDNRAGSGGTLGMGVAAHMPADGYTLVMGASSYVVVAPAALPFRTTARLKMLATTGLARSRILPQVPTVSESGLKDYEVTTWYGILVPAGTPEAIVNKLQTDIARVIRQPDTKERIASEGGDVVASTPAQFAAFMAGELAKWAKFAKLSGAKVD